MQAALRYWLREYRFWSNCTCDTCDFGRRRAMHNIDDIMTNVGIWGEGED